MASISQPFRLSVLPKIPSLNNYANQTEYLQLVDSLSPSTNKVSIGISGSSISQYLINPTPKLVFNLPIPSTNVVTACTVAETSSDIETWCYSLEAKKTSHLNLITKPITLDATSSSTADTLSHVKLKLKSKAVSIRIYPKSERIIVILKNGLIQTFDMELKLLNTANISYENVQFVQFFNDGDQNEFVFVLCQLKDDKICYKLYQLTDSITCNELNSVILENNNLDGAKLCYQYGKVYMLKDCNELTVYLLPHFQLQSSINLPFIEKNSVVSIKPISSNRVLITSNSTIFLVDLLHNAILSEKQLKNVKTVQLLSCGVIAGNSEDNKKTLALGVSTKHGENPTSSLDVINVDVGTGTLKDSMGKGFLLNPKQKLQKLFDDEENDDEEAELPFPQYEEILKQLGSCKKQENFDMVFFKKLSLKKEYYTESDRFLNDIEFLVKVIDILFKNFQHDYPKALTYLLTHPLFPPVHTKGLLEKLKSNPRLFKQTIVTCPTLPLDDLLNQLFNITNTELCYDLSLRVLQDYSKESIKTAIKKVQKVDITNLLDMIIESGEKSSDTQLTKPQIFQLMSLIIDSIGLFSLDDEYLNRLSSFVNNQASIAGKNIELLHLLDHDTKHGSHYNQKNNSSSHSQSQPISSYTVDYLEC